MEISVSPWCLFPVGLSCYGFELCPDFRYCDEDNAYLQQIVWVMNSLAKNFHIIFKGCIKKYPK